MRNAIEKVLKQEWKGYVIYPFGEQGKLFKKILNSEYDIEEEFIIDNKAEDETSNIKRINELTREMIKDKLIFLVSDNFDLYFELRDQLFRITTKSNVVDVLMENVNIYDKAKNKSEGRFKVLFNPLIMCHEGNLENSTGGNTGNFVFVEAIKENIKFDIETKCTLEWVKEKRGNSNVKSVMPASNFLGAGTKWIENLVPILENTDMDFTLVGLGAQASFDETPKDIISKLSEKQKLFFQLASEHTVAIGVRGEFTAECLNELGIKNVEIIGCPSFYCYSDNYPVLPKASLDNVLFTVDESKKKIYDLGKQADAYLVSQIKEDTRFAETKNVIFNNYNDWNQFILNEHFSFAFGTRFHGNMMALRNKVPALWIVHDWRTLELVEYLGLPHMNYFDEKFQNLKNIEDLIEYCDYSKVYKNYPELYQKYSNYINNIFR